MLMLYFFSGNRLICTTLGSSVTYCNRIALLKNVLTAAAVMLLNVLGFRLTY